MRKEILEYLSSITATRRTKRNQLRHCYPKGTVGQTSGSERKSESAESCAPTATESTPPSSKDTTDTNSSEQSLTESTQSMESTQALLDGLSNGNKTLADLTVLEFIQLSFLYAAENKEYQIDQKLIYGGNVFTVRCAVTEINPIQAAYDILDKLQ